MQPTLLPSAIPARHFRHFVAANAGTYPEKKVLWYPLKTRILHIHGLPDGFDIQHIERRCHDCDGTGWWSRIIKKDGTIKGIDACWSCDNTGIYEKRKIALRRWLLNGHIFHEPTTIEWQRITRKVHDRIDGIITHTDAPPAAVARRACYRMLLRYDPTLWLELKWSALKSGILPPRRAARVNLAASIASTRSTPSIASTKA